MSKEINNQKESEKDNQKLICPNSNCDNNGTIATWNATINEWQPEPCQWCHENKKERIAREAK